jgi:hypothetical protein
MRRPRRPVPLPTSQSKRGALASDKDPFLGILCPVGGVTGWGWVFVVLGFIFDMGHWAGGGQSARRQYSAA